MNVHQDACNIQYLIPTPIIQLRFLLNKLLLHYVHKEHVDLRENAKKTAFMAWMLNTKTQFEHVAYHYWIPNTRFTQLNMNKRKITLASVKKYIPINLVTYSSHRCLVYIHACLSVNG